MSEAFTPPYIVVGLYNRESREAIESSNRATVGRIFARRAAVQHKKGELERIRQNHNRGIHSFGYCPFCPANVFYD